MPSYKLNGKTCFSTPTSDDPSEWVVGRFSLGKNKREKRIPLTRIKQNLRMLGHAKER
jgi:hypothetical protein